MRMGLYPGSFDPVTFGHIDIVRRAARLVDKLVIAVGTHHDKHPLFTAEERVEQVERITKSLGNVSVQQFAGLAVQFVRECDARVIVRGVRSLSDMDTEFTMTLANRKLDPTIETVFLMADEEFSHVSSTLIKQITPLASDEELARFVPLGIVADLRGKIQSS